MSGLELPTAQTAATLTPQATTLLSAGVQAGATLVVGLAQGVLIWAGLRQIRTASATRDRQMDYQHTETMTALTTLIERSEKRHDSW